MAAGALAAGAGGWLGSAAHVPLAITSASTQAAVVIPGTLQMARSMAGEGPTGQGRGRKGVPRAPSPQHCSEMGMCRKPLTEKGIVTAIQPAWRTSRREGRSVRSHKLYRTCRSGNLSSGGGSQPGLRIGTEVTGSSVANLPLAQRCGRRGWLLGSRRRDSLHSFRGAGFVARSRPCATNAMNPQRSALPPALAGALPRLGPVAHQRSETDPTTQKIVGRARRYSGPGYDQSGRRRLRSGGTNSGRQRKRQADERGPAAPDGPTARRGTDLRGNRAHLWRDQAACRANPSGQRGDENRAALLRLSRRGGIRGQPGAARGPPALLGLPGDDPRHTVRRAREDAPPGRRPDPGGVGPQDGVDRSGDFVVREGYEEAGGPDPGPVGRSSRPGVDRWGLRSGNPPEALPKNPAAARR